LFGFVLKLVVPKPANTPPAATSEPPQSIASRNGSAVWLAHVAYAARRFGTVGFRVLKLAFVLFRFRPTD
jgi:hypothetical protein